MFPLHCVLVAITVVGIINVSVVRTETRDTPNQARCSGLPISFLGEHSWLQHKPGSPFPISIYFHIKTTSDFRGTQEDCFTFNIQVSQIATDSERLF